MPSASILIKPASANCNMDCGYCFYKVLSSSREQYNMGFMTEVVLEKLIKNALDYADGSVTFAFQGGEPTLAGLDFYRKAVALQKNYNTRGLEIENTIQTNGLLIDEEWAVFLAEERFLVGLSLDGPRKVHDRWRLDTGGKDTFYRVMHTAELLKRHGVTYNILAVVTQEACSRAGYIYQFFRKQGFSFLQFIPCMDEPGRGCSASGKNSYAVNPVDYGRFLCELFDLWYTDFMNGMDIEIRMFSNLAQMAAGYPAEECGMCGRCTCYFVVEGDGSVYPCDFYCTDAYRLGDVTQPFSRMIVSEAAVRFVEASVKKPEKCMQCPYFKYCHGGCRRWREQGDEIALNALCPAYEMFFEHTAERIEELGQLIIRRYGEGKE